MAVRLSALGREPDEWARATVAARAVRERVADELMRELVERAASQAAELVVSGDVMGGRAMLAAKVRSVVAAAQRGDERLERAALMEVVVAGGAMIAAIDYVAPPDV